MQLQKRFNRKVGDKEYSKWQVVIPPETIEALGWDEGDELKEEVQGKKLTLTPKTKPDELNYTRHKRVKKIGS